MSERTPKSIADAYFGDTLSRKIQDGKRCCSYGPSIFKAGYGEAKLLIDNETLVAYVLPSAMYCYADLPFVDYNDSLGLFTWPEEGGQPIPNEQKILQKQIEDARATYSTANSEQVRWLVDCLTDLARSHLYSNDHNYAEAEKLLTEALSIQMEHHQKFSSPNDTLKRYLWLLTKLNRSEEARQLQSQWDVLKAPLNRATSRPLASTTEPGSSNMKIASELISSATEAGLFADTNKSEELYKKAITMLTIEKPADRRDKLLMMAYSGYTKLLIEKNQFQQAVDPLKCSIAVFESSQDKSDLSFIAATSFRRLKECLTALGRESELAKLAEQIGSDI